MATCDGPVDRGEMVHITLRGVGAVPARVVWSHANRIGLAFEKAIEPARTRQPTAPRSESRIVPPVTDSRRPGIRKW